MTAQTLSDYLKSYAVNTGYYDETFDAQGQARPHYQALVRLLLELSADELSYRQHAADLTFLNQGITFTVYSDEEGTERTFPFDLLPRIIPGAEWNHIETGLTQRIIALNHFLHDVYHDGKIFKDKVIPYELIASSKYYRREMRGVDLPLTLTYRCVGRIWCVYPMGSSWC